MSRSARTRRLRRCRSNSMKRCWRGRCSAAETSRSTLRSSWRYRIAALAGSDLPGGTVTFLFTDVEASTKLLHELGSEAYAPRLAEHRRVIRDAVVTHGGVEVDTQGDGFFVAFP